MNASAIFKAFIFSLPGLLGPYTLSKALGQPLKPDKSITSLVSAEKAFQKDLLFRGQKNAYLGVLTENSMVFRPEVTNGAAYYLKANRFQGILNWEPNWVETSKDGYFGYTTGPYRYLINDSTAYGDYVSIWIRDPYKTKWRLFVNGGAAHGKSSSSNLSLSYPLTVTNPYPSIYPAIIEQSKDILLSTDILFATMMSTRTNRSAYQDYLTPDARLLQDGQYPIKGRDSILNSITLQRGNLFFRPSACYVSYSNDMGFTHGTGDYIDQNRKTHRDRKFSYLRIWRLGNDGLWRIALELRIKKE